MRKLEKSISETITRYDEKGNVRRVRQGKPAKKVVIPGMYKPTKSKEHKALGHKGKNMRQKRKDKPAQKGTREERKSKYSMKEDASGRCRCTLLSFDLFQAFPLVIQ